MPDLLRRHLLWTGALAPLALALPSPARAKVPPAPAGLSAGSTAEQATAGLDLRGRTILVTGCNSGIGLETMRVEDRSGVWLPASGGKRERKICAIGVRVAKGVTMHGFALNCDNSLAPFGEIVPCGISDAGVTTLSEVVGADVSPADVLDTVASVFSDAYATVLR